MRIYTLILTIMWLVYASVWAETENVTLVEQDEETSIVDPNDPVVILRTTAENIINELKNNKSLYQKDVNALYRLVYRELVPMVDQTGIARSILGREHWREATAQQRTAFIKQFTDLVVVTYAGALSDYDDETITFSSNVRGNIEDKSRIVISSVVEHTGNEIPVQFSLVYKDDENAWRVYDLNVSGVSMLRSFREQVSERLQSISLDQLIEQLAKKQLDLTVPGDNG